MPIIPTLWEAEARSSRPVCSTWWNPISTKNTIISCVSWWLPIIPATWEAEARESLEPGRWRLQWAEIALTLHSSLGNKKLCLKKYIYICPARFNRQHQTRRFWGQQTASDHLSLRDRNEVCHGHTILDEPWSNQWRRLWKKSRHPECCMYCGRNANWKASLGWIWSNGCHL